MPCTPSINIALQLDNQATMANTCFLSLFVLILSIGSCFAYQRHELQQGKQWEQFNECQLDKINALEPDNRIDAEAGRIESWNPNHQQFRCAGVALLKITVEKNGLYLPGYTNTNQLLYVVTGRGYFSVVIPGCAETFEESSQSQGGGEGGRSQDRHQKIRHFREGDIVALPAGAAFWMYNHGDSPLVTVKLLDMSNHNNQLDRNPRKFYLAGNPQQPFEQEHQKSRRFAQQGQQGSNMFSGFDTEFLARVFNVNTETIRNVQGQNDNRNNIVRVQEGELRAIFPGMEREEQHRGRDNDNDNGLEETVCALRLRQNIGDSSRSDVFNPEAGRLTTANSNTLPILNWFQLSAERGTLYRNGIFVPHWEMNAHSILYGLRGSGRIQIVDHNGNNVFNGELREGQILTIPQGFAVAKQSNDEQFEYVAFKTNDNAMVSPLVGRTSALNGMPADVLANAFQIRTEEALRLKRNPDVTLLSSSSRSQSGRRYDA